jgi:hypothetical protein
MRGKAAIPPFPRIRGRTNRLRVGKLSVMTRRLLADGIMGHMKALGFWPTPHQFTVRGMPIGAPGLLGAPGVAYIILELRSQRGKTARF